MGKKSKLTGKSNKKRYKQHLETIKWTEDKAKSFEDYKPSQFANLSQKTYADRLPDRPKAPKLPKLTTPGGDLIKDQTLNPSGLPGISNKYRSPSDYSKVYTNALKPVSPPRLQTAGTKIQPKPASTLGPSGPNYKPTNKGLGKWGPAVKKGLGNIGPLKVPSTTQGSPSLKPVKGPSGITSSGKPNKLKNIGPGKSNKSGSGVKITDAMKGPSGTKPQGKPSKVFTRPGQNSLLAKSGKSLQELMNMLKGKNK